MDIKDFVYHLLYEGCQLLNHPRHSEFRPSVAILSSLFDFACNFGGDKCAGKRIEECCCKSCAYSLGHLGKRWPNDLEILVIYAKGFDKDTGFWRKNTGCILPRHLRSLTCSFYVCMGTREEFTKRNDESLEELRFSVGRYTSCDYYYGSRGGQYHKEVLKTEVELDKIVEELMWNRQLYYDSFKGKLIRVVKTDVDKRDYIVQHLEDGREVGFYKKLEGGANG